MNFRIVRCRLTNFYYTALDDRGERLGVECKVTMKTCRNVGERNTQMLFNRLECFENTFISK